MIPISQIIYGAAKVGKSTFADTAPKPHLVLDAEGGNDFTPSRKVIWDPLREAPPAKNGWETAIVYCRGYDTAIRTYEWLNSGQHPFRSVTLDSVSEVQQRCIDSIAGTEQMKTQQWGEVLRLMSKLVRDFRDLKMHPTNPLEVVTLISMARELEGKWQPYVQGQLGIRLPYYFDVVGYMFTQQLEDGRNIRRLLTEPTAVFEAGDRTGALGSVVDEPTIPMMLAKVESHLASLRQPVKYESQDSGGNEG
jgi:AAA domain